MMIQQKIKMNLEPTTKDHSLQLWVGVSGSSFDDYAPWGYCYFVHDLTSVFAEHDFLLAFQLALEMERVWIIFITVDFR